MHSLMYITKFAKKVSEVQKPRCCVLYDANDFKLIYRTPGARWMGLITDK